MSNPASTADPVSVPVRVRPGASRTRVGGRYDGPYGPAIVVAVTAPPVDGKATRAVLIAVAKALGVRRSAVTVRTGETSRDKLLRVEGAPPELLDRVAELRDGDS
ncbi:MAG: DUF167 domain-containing protein [Micromonosporaceae bacterium]